ncbi:hypothetical protein WA026_011947 [Henosepilachna vigintioctopunctata]
MRIILSCDRYTRIKNMLEELKWVQISDYIEMLAMKFIYKCIVKKMPNYCNERLTTFQEVHNYGTRNKMNFIVGHRNKTTTQNSLFHGALLKYNSLPKKIKDCTSFKSFNKQLFDYYLNRM